MRKSRKTSSLEDKTKSDEECDRVDVVDVMDRDSFLDNIEALVVAPDHHQFVGLVGRFGRPLSTSSAAQAISHLRLGDLIFATEVIP